MVLPFCFDVGFVFGMFYFVLVLFLFCFLFAFPDYEKNTVFPAILVYFSHVGYKVVYIFQFQVLVIVCFLLCCLFPF